MLDKRPLVTVLIRSYQCAGTLSLAVASVLAQTFEDLECLIVDDGSTDATQEIAAGFRDPRVRYVRLPANLGRASAKKVGVALARGEYLALLDADDWWYPQKLALQLPVLQANPDLALVSAGVVLLDERSDAYAIEALRPGEPELVRFEPMRRPKRVPVPYASSLMRLDTARKVPLDLGLERAEDFAFMLALALRSPFGLLNRPLYAYVCPPVGRAETHAVSAAVRRRIYAKYLRRWPLASLFGQAESIAKAVVFAAAGPLGLRERVVPRRGRSLTAGEQEEFVRARERVLELQAGLGHVRGEP